MALQVTTANPGTISGVTTAQPGQSITGVTTANPGTISGVQSSPSSGGANYNPQSAAAPASVVQPAATVKTVMPNTTSAAVVNQTPTADSQRYALGDGSVYDSSGKQLSGPTTNSGTATGYSGTPGGATTTSTGTSVNTPTPTVTQSSTSLTNDTTYSDIQKLLTNNLANMDKLFANMQTYATVPQNEQDQQKKVASDAGQVNTYSGQAAGLDNPDGQAIALPFLQGQGAQKLRTAQIQQGVDQATLNYMQGNRQFAFNSASTIFDASRNQLSTALDAYTKMAPQNIGTNYNPSTGAVTAFMRNPISGATYTADLGNIGAQHSFTSTNITTDPMTGALTFVGTTADGKVVQQPIGGGSSFASGGTSNPLQGSAGAGNYTQTSNPQVPNAGALLSNWTSGGKTMPGAGYQGAVYQEFARQTGQTIDANTPTSTLVSNIPALAAGIAKAENISPALLAATNNPGAILYANQPGATAYHAQNGYTYAKFNTLQDGQNAMNNLIAKKLGASPQTPTAATPNLQQTVKSLPPALAGAVHYLPDGTPFFNANQLTAAQIPMAQYAAQSTGIPYINGDNASKLDSISVAQQNIKDLSDFAQKTLFSGGGIPVVGGILAKAGNYIQGSGLNTLFGSNIQTNFDLYRNLAISTLQGMVGGTGSGLRITAGEIANQIDNLPKSTDTAGQAATKVAKVNAQLNSWISQIIPHWQPQGGSNGNSSQGVDYTATLNNLMSNYSPQ